MTRVLGPYLRKRVAVSIIGLLAALTGLMQLLELLDVTTDVLNRNLGVTGIVHYAVLRLPGEMAVALPLAALLGSMSAFYAMARSREITALRSAPAWGPSCRAMSSSTPLIAPERAAAA